MSLFGGDSSAPPTESEYESESDNSLSSFAQSQTLQAQLETRDAAAEDAAIDAPGNDADSEESTGEEPERPNRFRGPPRTWKGYTAADRQIAESLQQLEDADLAAHLYNAHALKRRAQKHTADISALETWQTKDAWLKQANELQHTDAAGQLQTELVPSKDWTAWPLPPASLDALSNGYRAASAAPEGEEWIIGGSEIGRAHV